MIHIYDYTYFTFHLLTEPVVERTLRASITEVSILLLFSDDTDIENPSFPVSALDDMRNSEMFSSCLSSENFEKSIISPATASSLNMHHLKAKCENIHLDLQVFILSDTAVLPSPCIILVSPSLVFFYFILFYFICADLSKKCKVQGINCPD